MNAMVYLGIFGIPLVLAAGIEVFLRHERRLAPRKAVPTAEAPPPDFTLDPKSQLLRQRLQGSAAYWVEPSPLPPLRIFVSFGSGMTGRGGETGLRRADLTS